MIFTCFFEKRPNSLDELKAVRDIITTYGHVTYQDGAMLEEEFPKRTGTHRAGGALYMCAWRMENGVYDDKLKSA